MDVTVNHQSSSDKKDYQAHNVTKLMAIGKTYYMHCYMRKWSKRH